MDSAFIRSEKYADWGVCYRPMRITPTEVCILFLQIIRRSNPIYRCIIMDHSFKIIYTLKISWNMLTWLCFPRSSFACFWTKSGYTKRMFSLADILRIAVLIRWVVFFAVPVMFLGSSSAFSSSQNVWNSPPSSVTQLSKQLSWRSLVPRASWLRSIFLSVPCTIDIILVDIASVFQIWSKLTGY